MKFYKKKWFKIIATIILVPLLLVSGAIAYVYWKQDEIVQKLLTSVNEDMPGEITVRDSHIALFHKFPYISVDLQDAILFSDKSKDESKEVIHLEDLYVGFNILDIVSSKYDVKAIELEKGHVDLTQLEDGSLDILQILGIDSSEEEEESSEAVHFALKKIDLDHVDISYRIAEKDVKYLAAFEHIHAKFKSKKEGMDIFLDTKFFGSIFKNGKVTPMNKKVFEINTDFKYINENSKILINPTEFNFEHVALDLKGFIELEGEQNMDIHMEGAKKNFDILIAFAPAELVPLLKLYDNQGDIFLKGDIKGSIKDGQMPAITAEFGCDRGFFKNEKNELKLDEIEFYGTFTNGEKRDLSTMKFTMSKLKARPAAGIFDAKIVVENFETPDIDLNLKSNFNLDFIVKFLNLEDEIRDPSGFVGLEMNFHDIIDLAHPELSLNNLNESYYTELVVKNLSFASKSYPLPIKDFNIHADVNGNRLTLEEFSGKIGKSDINIVGSVSDVPAIIHQLDDVVQTNLTVMANHVDIGELTYNAQTKSSAMNEVVEDFKLSVSLNSSAKELFQFEHLPIGDFILNELDAKFENYDHAIHDVSGGFYIEENDVKIKRLKGYIDQSDFSLSGKLESYRHLFKPTNKAKSVFKLFFKSDLIRMDNLLTYKGENMLPESVQKETFSDVKLKATISARFNGEEMMGSMIELREFNVTTSMHEKRFSNLNGKIFLSKNSVALKNLKGNIGQSDFDISLNYFIGANDSLKKRDNEIKFYSNYFDLNEIMAIKYNPATDQQVVASTHVAEEVPFTINDIPFMDLKLETDIKHFEYLDYKLDRIKGNINMHKNKTLDFYRFGFDVAGGKIRLTGNLNAMDSTNIRFNPSLWVKGMVIDQTLMRFKNFGQENILSENLSGRLDARIKGTIPLNMDLTPKMESTNLSLDITIFEGELKNFKPLEEFASFFGDKNLSRIRFDTLHNVFTLNNNLFTIPWMTVNTSIGFLEVAGTQMLDEKMDM